MRVLLVLLAAWLGACSEPREPASSAARGGASDVAPADTGGATAAPLTPYRDGELWGYRDRAGRAAIPPRFRAASAFEGGRALVQLGEEFVFVDVAGEVAGKLLPAGDVPLPPLPSAACATLADYARELGHLAAPRQLAVNPSQGESYLALDVRPLAHGAVEVIEHGWEGMSVVVILPHADVAHARRVLARILAHHPHADISGQQSFADDVVTFQLTSSAYPGEFYGIRRRQGGGVALHHTWWGA